MFRTPQCLGSWEGERKQHLYYVSGQQKEEKQLKKEKIRSDGRIGGKGRGNKVFHLFILVSDVAYIFKKMLLIDNHILFL